MNSSSFKIIAAATALSVMAGCSKMNRTAGGGIIGAGTGGVLGGVIGKQAGNTTAGILIGAALGGAAGASIGRYMDKQAAELDRDLENARVERVGEGIKITFASGILFNTDSAVLQADAKTNIEELAQTLNKYNDTKVVVQGYTDSTGSDEHNLELSRRRAASVGDYLKTRNVSGERIDAAGMGETNAVSDNGTEAGRRANRRVEVAIFANEKLKKAAERGELPS